VHLAITTGLGGLGKITCKVFFSVFYVQCSSARTQCCTNLLTVTEAYLWLLRGIASNCTGYRSLRVLHGCGRARTHVYEFVSCV